MRRIKYKFSHSLHDVLEYVRLNPELVAGKIRRSRVSKAMKAEQIDTYRMHMVLMLDYDALERFDKILRDGDMAGSSVKRKDLQWQAS